MIKAIRVMLAAVTAMACSYVQAQTLGDLQNVSTSGPIVAGEWNTQYQAGLDYAKAHDCPIVLFWANPGCGNCEKLEKACNTDEFVNWRKERKFVLIFAYGGAAEKAVAKNSTGKFPYIYVNWPGHGEKRFSGIANGMPAQSWTKGDGTVSKTLAAKFIASIELVTAGYSPVPPYNGGEFQIAGTENSRLEFIAGKTKAVEVPLVRTVDASKAGANTLRAGAVSKPISWAANETRKLVTVDVSAAAADVPLALLDDQGAVHATSSIVKVDDPGNTWKNPVFDTDADSLQWGQWTMDLEAAKDKANRDGGCTLVYMTGALWCPWCKGLERDFLESSQFKGYVENQDNKVALVILDNLKRSANDSTKAPYALSTVANGAGPSLLSYETSADGVSGAAYLSRQGLTETVAKAKLQSNHVLGYLDGALCAPGNLRTGYPTLLLLGSDGKVRGAFNPWFAGVKDGGAYASDPAEDFIRFQEFMKLATAAPADYANSFAQTTELEHSIGTETTGVKLSVNASAKVFRIANRVSGKVVVDLISNTCQDSPITFSLLELEPTSVARKNGNGGVEKVSEVAMAKTVVASTGAKLEYSFDASKEYYLKVSAFDNAEDTKYGESARQCPVIAFASSVVLYPAEKAASYTAAGTVLRIKLSEPAGTVYRFSGVDDLAEQLGEAFVHTEGDFYTLKSGAPATLGLYCKVGDAFGYQVWRPGRISFGRTEDQIFRMDGKKAFQVLRTNGASEDVTVKVAIDPAGSTADPSRYDWTDAELSWASGNADAKSFELIMRKDAPFFPNQTIRFVLSYVTGEEEVEIAQEALVVTLTDTDKPTVGTDRIDLVLYKGFNAFFGEPLTVYNLKGTGKVSIKKVGGGKLPSGVSLKFDKDSQSLDLSGRAKKTGSYPYVFAVSESGNGEGPATTVNVTVVDPTTINGFLGQKIKMTLPLFAGAGSGDEALAGVVELQATSGNKLTAKYSCDATTKKVSFSGYWDGLDDAGGAYTLLTAKNGAALELHLSAAGIVSARLLDLANYAEVLESGDYRIPVGGYSAYRGTYTCAFPVLATTAAGYTGTPCATIKLTSASAVRNGTASCKVYLAGKSVSVNASVLPIDDNWAALVIFKQSTRDFLGICTKIRRGEAAGLCPTRRAIVAMPGVSSYWRHSESGSSFLATVGAYGSFFDADASLIDCCGDDTLRYGFDTVLPVVGNGSIIKLGPSSMGLESRISGLSINYAKKTGLFSGSTKISGASAKYVGVILPDWYDCGCREMASDPLIPSESGIPFGFGALNYTQKNGGRSATYGFAVRLLNDD